MSKAGVQSNQTRGLGCQRRNGIDWTTALLILVLFCLCSFTHLAGYEFEYFLSARNLLSGNGVSMSADFPDIPGVPPRPVGATVYPRHGLLQVFLIAPFYAAGDFLEKCIREEKPPSGTQYPSSLPMGPLVAVSFFNPVVTLVEAILLARIVMLLGATASAANRLMLLFCTATMAWPYAETGMEPLQGMGLLLSVWGFIRFGRRKDFISVIAATAGMIAVALHKHYGPGFLAPLLIFGIMTVIASGRKRIIFASIPIAGFLVDLSLWMFQIHLRNAAGTNFYSPSFMDQVKIRVSIETLWGLLLSPGKGLFFYSPILLLGIPGILEFCRLHRRTALAIGLIMGTNILMVIPWSFALAEETWGPRYLYPLVPMLMILGFRSLTADRPRLRSKLIFASVLFISLLIQIPAAMYPGDYAYLIPLRNGIDNLSSIAFVPTLSPIRSLSLLALNRLSRTAGGPPLALRWDYYDQMPGVGGTLKSATADLSAYDTPASLPFVLQEYLQERKIFSAGYRIVSAAFFGTIGILLILLYWRNYRKYRSLEMD
jgi:hypothetical protein